MAGFAYLLVFPQLSFNEGPQCFTRGFGLHHNGKWRGGHQDGGIWQERKGPTEGFEKTLGGFTVCVRKRVLRNGHEPGQRSLSGRRFNEFQPSGSFGTFVCLVESIECCWRVFERGGEDICCGTSMYALQKIQRWPCWMTVSVKRSINPSSQPRNQTWVSCGSISCGLPVVTRSALSCCSHGYHNTLTTV